MTLREALRHAAVFGLCFVPASPAFAQSLSSVQGKGVIAGQYTSLQAAVNASLSVLAPYGTPTTTFVVGARPWNVNDPSTDQGSVQAPGQYILDQRFGEKVEACWDPGTDGNTTGNRMCNTQISQLTAAATAPYQTTYTAALIENDIAGGYNSTTSKTSRGADWSTGFNYSPGQHILGNKGNFCLSIGDCVGQNITVEGDGGNPTASDEGVEPIRMQGITGHVVLLATLASGSGGATSVTMNTPTAGAGRQGAGRYLQDQTRAESCGGATTVTTIAGSGPTVFTLSGAGCSVSTAHTTTTSAVTLPDIPTATSETLSVAASAGFAAGMACIADAGAYETAQITGIPDSTHITVTMRKTHAGGAIVAQGGACGEVVSLAADTWTATGQYSDWNITAPVLQALPVIYSDATHLYVWIAITGFWDIYGGAATTSSGSNAFALYPAAEVLDVSNGTGAVSNTLTLYPNAAAWAPGDSVALPPYPFEKASLSHWNLTRLYPSQPIAPSGGGVDYYGIFQGGDCLWCLHNFTNKNFYTSYGGKFSAPFGIRLDGTYSYPFRVSNFPTQGAFSVGYDPAAPSNSVPVLRAESSNTIDFLYYDTTNKKWVLTANGQSASYGFDLNGISTTENVSANIYNAWDSSFVTHAQINGTTGVISGASYGIFGGASGVTCSGTPTSSFASVGGIITHC